MMEKIKRTKANFNSELEDVLKIYDMDNTDEIELIIGNKFKWEMEVWMEESNLVT